MKLKKEVKGSYTIEAAFLMGILLPLFVAIIYMGFFLHDKGFLQSAAFETAACVSLHADEKDLDGNQMVNDLITGRMLGTKNEEAYAVSGKKEVEISCCGSFFVPGMSRMFFGENGIALKAKTTLNLERPSRRIQKIRGVAKVIQTFRRTLE
ncbi:MAG: pilus assembly protein [Eubacteriales bacterium]|nr:pilus assembly protein [Eubacteriales bacterium]